MDEELADAAAYAPGRRYVYTHQTAAHLCLKCWHGRHLKRMTSHEKSDFDAYLLEEKKKSCQISPDPI